MNEEEYNPEDDIAAELKDVVRTLAAENDALMDRIATGVMEGTEEEKRVAAETIGSLRKEVDVLRKTLDATEATRDAYQRESTELKRQCAMQRREIERLKRRCQASTIPDRSQAPMDAPASVAEEAWEIRSMHIYPHVSAT